MWLQVNLDQVVDQINDPIFFNARQSISSGFRTTIIPERSLSNFNEQLHVFSNGVTVFFSVRFSYDYSEVGLRLGVVGKRDWILDPQFIA